MWLRKNSVWIWARIKQPLNTVRFIATQHYTMMRISMINVCTYWCLIIFNKYTPVCQRDVPKSVVVNLVEKNVYTCLKNRTQQKIYSHTQWKLFGISWHILNLPSDPRNYSNWVQNIKKTWFENPEICHRFTLWSATH